MPDINSQDVVGQPRPVPSNQTRTEQQSISDGYAKLTDPAPQRPVKSADDAAFQPRAIRDTPLCGATGGSHDWSVGNDPHPGHVAGYTPPCDDFAAPSQLLGDMVSGPTVLRDDPGLGQPAGDLISGGERPPRAVESTEDFGARDVGPGGQKNAPDSIVGRRR